MTAKYILDESGEPVAEPSLFKWAMWMEAADLRVAEHISGSIRVSTVFFGLDYNLGATGEPLLWETMVFGGRCDRDQRRCGGPRANAQKQHDDVVKHVERIESEDGLNH